MLYQTYRITHLEDIYKKIDQYAEACGKLMATYPTRTTSPTPATLERILCGNINRTNMSSIITSSYTVQKHYDIVLSFYDLNALVLNFVVTLAYSLQWCQMSVRRYQCSCLPSILVNRLPMGFPHKGSAMRQAPPCHDIVSLYAL